MTEQQLKIASTTALAAAMATPASAAQDPRVQDLVTKISSSDADIRTAAWQTAGTLGAPAVTSLAALLTNPDMQVARAAKRGLWKIVHTVGAPGSETAAKAVVQELLPVLKSPSPAVRREVLWMLSEIAHEDAVEPIAPLLQDKEVREDARAALQRIPGDKSLAALKFALASAPEEFKHAIAESLRDRAVKMADFPSRKLVPTKQTTVKPE